MADTVEQLWSRIRQWYDANVPSFSTDRAVRWGHGATEEQIAGAEEVLGVRFPEEMRATYRFCNGHNLRWFLEEGSLMSLKQIVGQWEMLNEVLDEGPMDLSPEDTPKDPIRPIWWNRGWVQFVDNSGNGACIDYDPLPGGVVGQVIYRDHEKGPVRVLARSFREWLEQFADDLDRGAFAVDESGNVVRAEKRAH
jgi:cell wall assembly regulator SMI1